MVLPYPLVAIRSTALSVPVLAGVPLAVPVIAPVFAFIFKPEGRVVDDQIGTYALTGTEYSG